MKKLCMILSMALILWFIVSCQDKEAMAELEELKAQAEVEEQNKALVKRCVETFNTGDYEALKELLSPDYVVYNPSGYPEPTSREVLIKNYKGALEAFSEFSWSIEDMIAAEDKVISRIIAKGTYKGGIPGLPKTGKKFEFSMITIMRIEDGKVVEEWQEDDQLGLARQLGMELKPKEETETHKEASPGEHAREGQDEHSEEGRGEHSGEGEETGQTFTLNETYDNIRKGVRLILSYDKASSSFIGTVENVTNRTIKSVRVEVHLSNGMELGPTSPIDLAPGKKTSVKLSAAEQSFNWWKAHPEAGSGEHSGEG